MSEIMAQSEQIVILKSSEKSECSFCFFEIPNGQGIKLNKCLHTFCNSCLKVAIEQQSEASEAHKVHCPFQAETKCEGYLLDEEIKSLMPPESDEKSEATLHGVKRKREDEPPTESEEPAAKRHAPETEADLELRHDWEIRWEQIQNVFQSAEASGLGMEYLVNTLKAGLLVSTVAFECSICMADIAIGDGIMLQECFHAFCRECLQSTIQYSEEPLVKCPFQGTHTTCDACMQEREIKALVSKELYEQYLSRSIDQAELSIQNAFHCKTADCPGWCEIEADVNDLNYECPVCKKTNCVQCKAIHDGISCKEYQSMKQKTANEEEATSDAIKKLIKEGKAMECPTCKVVIVKNGGCSYVRCKVCKTSIIWGTELTATGWFSSFLLHLMFA